MAPAPRAAWDSSPCSHLAYLVRLAATSREAAEEVNKAGSGVSPACPPQRPPTPGPGVRAFQDTIPAMLSTGLLAVRRKYRTKSDSVRMPTTREPSVTGRQPYLLSNITAAASCRP